MLAVLLAFLIGAGAIVGGYALLTFLPGFLARRQLDSRLREVSPGEASLDATSSDTVVRRQLEGPWPSIDRLAKRTRAGFRLGQLIEQSGIRTTPSAIVVIMLVAAAICGFAAAMFVGHPLAILGAGAFGAFLPFGWLRNRRSARIKRFEELFPEALDLLSRAVRAGHAFQTALMMAAEELPPPVGPELKKTFEQQNFGLPLKDALNQLAERISLLDVRFFVTAVLIQRETGGNLAEILDNLAHVVRERFKIQRQVRVHTAHGRFTGYVLLSLPAFLAIALSIINPDHMKPMFHERMGQQMLGIALVMQVIGYFWIRKVIKIEV